jgi:hypothetical protein
LIHERSTRASYVHENTIRNEAERKPSKKRDEKQAKETAATLTLSTSSREDEKKSAKTVKE